MPKSFEVDLKQLKKYEKDLRIFSSKAFFFAEKSTVNDGAFFAMKATKKLMQREFTLRNTFTQRRVSLVKATSLRNPVARMGSTLPYMFDQEFGGERKKTGKHGVAIPTKAASGEGKGKGKRLKVVRPRNRLARLKVSNRKRKRNVAASIQDAVAHGEKIVFLKLKTGKQGIFEISGKKGRRLALTMLYDLSELSVPVPKSPTISPATEKAARRMEQFYVENIKFQLRRHGMFTD